MIILVNFDWNANGKELKKWTQQFKVACNNNGMTFKGLYIPLGQKFNFTWMIESDSIDKYIETTQALMRPPAMTHFITETLIEQEFDK